jgi:Tol biopolymer transport system component
MNPDGTGLTRISTDIYANDVTRGQAVMTVLMNVIPGVDIQALRADGVGGLVPLVTSAEGESSLRFSPDGGRIAYKVNRIGGASGTEEIRTADVVRDGSGNVTGVANIQTAWMGTWYVRALDFSRDGGRLVVAAAPTGGAPDLYLLDLGDGSWEQLTSTPEYETGPRWSPSDDRIAFFRYENGGTGIASLLTIDAGTGSEVTVLNGQSSKYASWITGAPAWSPGATHLMAVVSGYKKPSDLHQFPSTGGPGVNVTASSDIQPTLPNWGW